ncbi:SURF1 family protein [Ruania halotolerans]|uniref:SURF1 family protein n=1 Tax=Ruania halotolerans TaxID=2897773 RepID=UPI001E4700BA|nr:SURF1 family protein [Ruania halotolerans]UFU05036.1 SURF1 family protein [Ruania halotolerans]
MSQARSAPASRYAFLRSHRWAGIGAVALVVCLTCTLLGHWQLTRYQGKAEAAALVTANYDADPVPLTEILPTADATWDDDLTWRQVQVNGSYLHPSVLLPQRPIDGSPADHVLAVFAADSGDPDSPWLLAVDRGWYRTDAFGNHEAQRELPEGEIIMTVRLRAAEPASERELADGSVHAINPAQVLDEAAPGADVAGLVVSGAYGVLAEESPTTAAPPAPLPRPSVELGNHLSYAFQWWVFAIGSLVGAVVLARREALAIAEHDRATGPDAVGNPPDGKDRPVSRRRRPSAEEEEDALIDAQLAARRTAPPDPPDGAPPHGAQASETSSR